MKSARLGYFLFPYNSPTDPTSPAMSTLKQCLHYDPDSPKCLKMHRLVKAFDKNFKTLDKALNAEDWRAVMKLLLGTDDSGTDGFAAKFDAALQEHITRENLELHPQIQVPDGRHTSPRRAVILKALCRAYIRTNQARKGEQWCSALLEMEGHDGDADGVIGYAEALFAREEWEEAVRVLERAFEASGRSDREVSRTCTACVSCKVSDHGLLADPPTVDEGAEALEAITSEGLLQGPRRSARCGPEDDQEGIVSTRTLDLSCASSTHDCSCSRKAVLTAHPDKGGSEAKMATVNEAYEVLSNPGMYSSISLAVLRSLNDAQSYGSASTMATTRTTRWRSRAATRSRVAPSPAISRSSSMASRMEEASSSTTARLATTSTRTRANRYFSLLDSVALVVVDSNSIFPSFLSTLLHVSNSTTRPVPVWLSAAVIHHLPSAIRPSYPSPPLHTFACPSPPLYKSVDPALAVCYRVCACPRTRSWIEPACRLNVGRLV